MSNKSLYAVGILALAGPVLAQTVLGKADDVQGLVTASDGVNIGNLVNNNPITAGTRFVTSSTGSATLKLNNGCNVGLKPNQSLTIQRDMSCEALFAAVQQLGESNGGLFAYDSPLWGFGLVNSVALLMPKIPKTSVAAPGPIANPPGPITTPPPPPSSPPVTNPPPPSSPPVTNPPGPIGGPPGPIGTPPAPISGL